MKVQTVEGARTLSAEPPRSTAYYYADLERLKRNNTGLQGDQNGCLNGGDAVSEIRQNPDELSEYVEANEVIKDGPIREVPPLRDRQRSSPECNSTKPMETYSTAGTFPMPEPKEKEPLLAELEIVGRLPLSQLDASSGVRRSRSWYFCCPNMVEEEASRESSWRYTSLRPITAPPVPGQNGLSTMTATESSGRVEDPTCLRAERDALARALAAERQRAATAARAHDARLAELHGVIAELVRRRAADKHSRAIPEEEVSDECESSTQPADQLDNDADRSKTEQNDSSSLRSVSELTTPQEPKVDIVVAEEGTEASSQGVQERAVETTAAPQLGSDKYDSTLYLTDKDSELCLNTGRCCQYTRTVHSGAGSCDREDGSAEGGAGGGVYTASPGRCESRQAKIASRVKLKRTGDADRTLQLTGEEAWCAAAAERLALDVCAQADLREALVSSADDESTLGACACLWRLRSARLAAECRVLECALARATDTAHRLSCACAVHESSSLGLCLALKAADRALETYDVLLALAETEGQRGEEREAAERVARQLLTRLDLEVEKPSGEPGLSPGPWLSHNNQSCEGRDGDGWGVVQEAALRRHAARLKSDTVTLRQHVAQPKLFSYYDCEEEVGMGVESAGGDLSMAEMEAAVLMQEALTARERRVMSLASNPADPRSTPDPPAATPTHHHNHHYEPKSELVRRNRERHWLDPQPSETDL